ncbi:hypothetical protein VPHD128_0055 [Vibrio phage D128]
MTSQELQKTAFLLQKQGLSVPQIAVKMERSERMIYRYLDVYELNQLRQWKKAVDEALKVTPMTAPVSQLVKIIKARK